MTSFVPTFFMSRRSESPSPSEMIPLKSSGCPAEGRGFMSTSIGAASTLKLLENENDILPALCRPDTMPVTAKESFPLNGTS